MATGSSGEERVERSLREGIKTLDCSEKKVMGRRRVKSIETEGVAERSLEQFVV